MRPVGNRDPVLQSPEAGGTRVERETAPSVSVGTGTKPSDAWVDRPIAPTGPNARPLSAELEQAAAVLRSLRTRALSFGNRSAALLAHYPSLEVMRLVAEAQPELVSAVAQALCGCAVPDDALPRVLKAVTGEGNTVRASAPAVSFDGVRATFPPTAVELGPHPLGSGGKDALDAKLKFIDPKPEDATADLFRLKDNAVALLRWGNGAPSLAEYFDKGQHHRWLLLQADALLLYARIAELSADDTHAGERDGIRPLVRAFLEQPLSSHVLTPESMPWLERLAKAVGVEPEDVRVAHPEHRDGLVQYVPLTEHPYLRGELCSADPLIPQPLGTLDFEDQQAVQAALDAANRHIFDASDTSLIRLGWVYTQRDAKVEIPSVVELMTRFDDPRVFQLYARMGELWTLGKPQASRYGTRHSKLCGGAQTLETRPIPAHLITTESVAWLIRLARSLLGDDSKLTYQEADGQIRPLRSHPAHAAHRARQHPAAEPLGDRSYSDPRMLELLSRGDSALFELDDESLERLRLLSDQFPNHFRITIPRGRPEWIAGSLRIRARLVELGLTYGSNDSMVLDLAAGKVELDWNDAEIMDAFVRVIRAERHQPSWASFWGASDKLRLPYEVQPGFLEALARSGPEPKDLSRRRRAEPRTTTTTPPMRSTPVRMSVWTDEGDFRVESFVKRFGEEEGFSNLAALAELSQPVHRSATVHRSIADFFSRPLPIEWSRSDLVPHLVRLATASNIPLRSIRLTELSMAVSLLVDHPAFPSHLAPRPALIAEAISVLNGTAPLEVRRAALAELLSSHTYVHEFEELVAAALDQTDLRRVSLEGGGSAARLFEEWEHPGEIAMLGGAFLKAPHEAVFGVLRRKGTPEQDARAWSRLAEALASLGPDERRSLSEYGQNPQRLILPIVLACLPRTEATLLAAALRLLPGEAAGLLRRAVASGNFEQLRENLPAILARLGVDAALSEGFAGGDAFLQTHRDIDALAALHPELPPAQLAEELGATLLVLPEEQAAVAAERAFARMQELDLQRVMSLTDADAELKARALGSG